MKKKLLLGFVAILSLQLTYAQKSTLSVEKIMQDPIWMGTFPSDVSWGAHSENIYFKYNPEKNPEDSLYKININNRDKIVKVDWREQEKLLPSRGDFNDAHTWKVYTRDNSLFIYDLKKRNEKQLLELGQPIQD
ncbi:hypothetical protein, partial [Longispora fulva]